MTPNKDIKALLNQALYHHNKNEFTKAVPLYQKYLEFQPDDAGCWSNLGAAFRATKKLDLACACHYRVLELLPDSARFLTNAANAFFENNRQKEAVLLRRRLIDAEPEKPENHAMLGKVLRGVREYRQAEVVLKRGLERFPKDTELHIQLAMALLALGDYKDGLTHFDYRWKGNELTYPKMKIPQWKGQDLTGKTIFVLPEQGFGDTVLFARFLRLLKETGATVLFRCKPPLQRLLSKLEGVDQLVEMASDISDADYWTPIMDMPLYLGLTTENIPAPSILNLPKKSINRAKSLVARYQDRFKVGVLWSGSLTYGGNSKRSFGHHHFLKLADIVGVQMFSLYKGPLLDEFVAGGNDVIMVNAAGSESDFADNAAFIQELDLVISMDSAVVHVAGSLGAPVWNLLHSEPYWLYELEEDTTPWYPSMRLIRQPKHGDWESTFDRVHRELTKAVAEWRDSRG